MVADLKIYRLEDENSACNTLQCRSTDYFEFSMKITFILPTVSLAGGIRVVAIYAEQLKRRGHIVTVISLPRLSLTLKQKIKYLVEEKKWPRNKIPQSYLDRLSLDHRILDRYRPVTNEDVPDGDVVVATWWETAEWVSSLHSSKGKKFYFVQGHEIFEGLPVERVKATYRLPLRKITISNWLVNKMKLEYGDENVDLVPNGVDSNFFNAKEREMQISPTVGFMYSTSKIKGTDIANNALKIARKSIPTLKIKSFGSCCISNSLPLPADTEFYYRPSQEKIREIYSSCDYWLFSSRSEGFGLPLLEAMACRTPVIATKAGAAPDLIGRVGGILLEDWSVENMSETIINAFNIKAENWRNLSQRGRIVASSYSWENATLLFEKALASN